MLAGTNRLRAAIEVLRLDGDGAADILLAGALEVWGAMFEMPSWPTEVRAKAVELQSSLFRYGPIRTTIQQMVVPERLQLRRELLEFCDLAERYSAAAGRSPLERLRPPK